MRFIIPYEANSYYFYLQYKCGKYSWKRYITQAKFYLWWEKGLCPSSLGEQKHGFTHIFRDSFSLWSLSVKKLSLTLIKSCLSYILSVSWSFLFLSIPLPLPREFTHYPFYFFHWNVSRAVIIILGVKQMRTAPKLC